MRARAGNVNRGEGGIAGDLHSSSSSNSYGSSTSSSHNI